MKYFGTDGFRGRANETLTVDHAFKIGKFLGWYYCKENHIQANCVIGKDTRKSSYMFEYALSAGLSSTGANVFLLHVTTTPSVSYVAKTENFDFGIMITASHNPYHDNGIKIINGDGYKMEEALLLQIEDYLDGKVEIPIAANDYIGKISDYIQGRNKYISYLTAATVCSFRGYHIGLDCANGAASSIAKTVFEMLGAKVFVINNEPDGLNINVGCGSTHIHRLQEFVCEKDLDIGFAFDGDADRCIAVDEKGNEVDGDQIIYICAKYMKEIGQLYDDTAVVTVMTNMGIERSLQKEGIRLVRTPVGDKYISQVLQEEGYSVGGEQSGHIIFNKYSSTGDGILTAIRLMEVVKEKKTMLSFLNSDVQLYPQLKVNKTVSDVEAVLGNTAVTGLVDRREREMGQKGRIVIRKSGTEPLLRIMVECEDGDKCREVMNQITAQIDEIESQAG